jgi:hypothetical protein
MWDDGSVVTSWMPIFSNMPLMGHGPNGIDLGGLSGEAHLVAVVEAVQAPGGSSTDMSGPSMKFYRLGDFP